MVAAIGEPAGVLICDKAGFLKTGRKSAGVQRQYSGTAGRVENCQLGVFPAYAVPGGGRALIDRELYLPESWASDRDRCREAGIADDVAFATKPELARQMIERAIGAGVPFGWVAADEAYEQNTALRDWLEQRRVRYVLAVPKSFTVSTAAGPHYYDWALIGTASPARHPAGTPPGRRRGTRVLHLPRPGRHHPR